MAAVTLDWIKPILVEYMDAVEAALVAAGLAPNRIVKVAPGVSPAWDDSCSQLYSRFITATPHAQTANDTAGCGVDYWIVQVAIVLTRCVGVPDVNGGRIKLPTAAKVEGDGFAMLDDLAQIGEVVKCYPRTRSIVAGRSLPEQGGQAGVEWEFTFRVDDCGCPPVEE